MSKFKPNDIIRRKKGTRPIHVSYTINGEVFGFHVKTGHPVENESEDKFVLVRRGLTRSQSERLEDQHRFVSGDIVRLKTGHAAIRVKAAYFHTYRGKSTSVLDAEYVNSEHKIYRRPQAHFDPYEGQEPITEKEDQMSTQSKAQLYEVPGKTKTAKTRFGTYLATTASGDIVIEVNGKAESFDPKTIKKVVPWTYTVKFSDTNSTMRFKGPEDCVAKGDMLVNGEGCVCTVTAVNTQSSQDCGEFSGRKLSTEALATITSTS